MKKLLNAILALFMVVALAACSSGTTSTPTEGTGDTATSSAPAADGQPTFKIGLHYELTGAVADYGMAELNGSKLAIEEANKAAGYEKFTSVEYDNKSDSTQAVQLATQLVSDGVDGVVGPATSGASAATYQILNDAGVVVISPSATQNNVTLTNPEDATSSAYPYVYRVCFEDSYQGAAMAQYTYDTLQKTKAVIYGDSASDYSAGLIKSFTDQFTKLGGSVVGTEYYIADDKDFSAVLTKIKDMDFDVLYIAGYYNEAGLIVKQAKEMGIDVTIVGGDGFDSESLADLAGATNLNNVYYTTAYTTVDASDKLQAFIDAYKAKYNEDPGMFAALAYDATMTLIGGLNEAGASGEALQKAIEAVNFDGITGTFTFDATHTPIKSVLVVELVDGVQSGATAVSPK